MKKRMSSLIPQAVGAATLLAAASSQAFFEDSSFYLVVPTVGYHYTDETDNADEAVKAYKADNSGLKIEFDDDAKYGISFGFQMNSKFAVEFAYDYSEYDAVIKTSASPDMKDKVTQHYIHFDHLYYFSDIYQNDFSFYIPVGIGYAKYDVDEELPEKGDWKSFRSVEDTVINFGLGAQYMFGDHFGIRGDVRGLYGFSQSNFDAYAQVGAVFRFGVPVPVGMADDDGIKTADIQFKLNSTQVVNADNPDIIALAEAVKNNPHANIKIFAYSDKSGNTNYNMKLSQRRADALKNVLMTKYGVDEYRIYTKAFGDEGGTSRSRHAVAVVEY